MHGAEFKKLFEQGLNRFPDQGQIQLLQAKLFIEGKNLDSACVKIRQGAVDARVSTELLGQLALLAMELVKSKEDWARAHELVLDLRHIYPEEPRFVALEGDLWISISKFQEAQTSYLQAARMGNPKFEVWARIVQLDFSSFSGAYVNRPSSSASSRSRYCQMKFSSEHDSLAMKHSSIPRSLSIFLKISNPRW